MTDWNQVAYNNALTALKRGQPMSVINSNQSKYLDANARAYADYKASQKKSSSKKKSAPAPKVKELPMATATVTSSDPIVKTADTPAPTLELPSLSFSDDASLENQIQKLSSKDSALMQQAKVTAHENGVASGGVHGSQQAGAAQKVILDAITPIAQAEATTAATEDVSNWTNQTQQALETFNNQYAERLAKIGYDAELQATMAKANTELSESLLNSITTLMNNPNIKFGTEVKNKLVQIFNTAQDNNNLILDMGFTY